MILDSTIDGTILQAFFKPCHLLDKTTVTVSGLFGPQEKYVEGAALDAAFLKDNSAEVRVAEANGLKELYTVVVHKPVTLRQGDVLRRDADQLTLRITGNTVDWEAPEMSTVQIAKVSAKVWDPPQ
jgi:hypothetical protein